MRRFITVLALVAAGTSLAPALSAVEGQQNWPSFRGANAAGTADGKPTAVKWNAATGENVAWKTPVDGIAVSSPIVWGNRVFVSTAVGSDPKQAIRTGQYGDVEPVTDASKHTWHLIALDKATGKVVWETELEGGTTAPPMTYLWQGKQYIVTAIGWGDHPGELVAFALGDTPAPRRIQR